MAASTVLEPSLTMIDDPCQVLMTVDHRHSPSHLASPSTNPMTSAQYPFDGKAHLHYMDFQASAQGPTSLALRVLHLYFLASKDFNWVHQVVIPLQSGPPIKIFYVGINGCLRTV